jgi:hypothetical protein
VHPSCSGIPCITKQDWHRLSAGEEVLSPDITAWHLQAYILGTITLIMVKAVSRQLI